MMRGVPETAEHEAGGERPEAGPTVGTGAAPSGPPRGAARRTVRPVAGIAAVAVLAAAAVGIALATRGGQTVPAAVAPTPPGPAVTVVPQPTSSAPPQASPSATAIPLALRQEIEQAYDRFWRVRADAALRLDPGRLPEVAAGTALEIETKNIEQLRAEGRAGRYVIDLQYGVVAATQTRAVVATKYQNRSYFVDPRTMQPLAPTPAAAEEVKMTFTLEKIDGTWKVVDGVLDPA
jgi:hypothetical protein